MKAVDAAESQSGKMFSDNICETNDTFVSSSQPPPTPKKK